VEVVHPRWAAWTFLVYAGGFVALGATTGWLQYIASRSNGAASAGWALLVFAMLAAVAANLKRSDHPVAAGVLAFVAVVAFVAFVGSVWDWFGWNTSATSLSGFHVSRLLLELIWFAAAMVALRRFRFPLLAAQVLLAGWLFVADLISNGGDWSAVVTLFVGLAYLAVAFAVDAGPSRPYGFWLHVGAGLAIGGSLLWFWHGGDVEWTLIVIASLSYVFFSQLVSRSSWAVLGAAGLLLAATHFTLEWTHVQVVFFNGGSASARAWVPPLVLTCLGFLLVALGLMISRRDAQVGQESTI